MELRDQLEAHKELITDRLDPDFGLLDELLTNRSLTRPEVARVKAVPDSYGRSEKLLEYIFDKGTCEKFLDALRKTQQTHLVNFIISSGGSLSIIITAVWSFSFNASLKNIEIGHTCIRLVYVFF